MSTIGELLEELRRHDPKTILKIGWDECSSYRGYYSEVAVRRAENISIEKMIQVLSDAMNNGPYYGWKGGEYTYGLYTDVYLVEDDPNGHSYEGNTGDEVGMEFLKIMIKNKFEAEKPPFKVNETHKDKKISYIQSLIHGTKTTIDDCKHKINIISQFQSCMIGSIGIKLVNRISNNIRMYNKEIVNSELRLKELEVLLEELKNE